MSDVFAIQDEISQAIAEKLRVHLSGDRPLVKRHTENVEAYTLYLKGRYQLVKFTSESMAKSKEYLEQAIAMDPNYTLAWHGLAMYYWYLGYLGFMSPKETNVKCSQATRRALELDETLAEAHSLMAMLLASEFDWKGSEREFRRALELNPESTDALANYSQFYLYAMRRFDEALVSARKALELDPLSPHLQWHLGHRYWIMGQYDRALEHFCNTLELDPQHYFAHLMIGLTYVVTGKLEEGIQACETAVNLEGRRGSYILAALGLTYLLADRTDDAKKILDELHELARKAYVSPTGLAYIYIGLGEIDKAFDWLDKAIDERDGMMINVVVVNIPFFNQLRSHPRYHALLRKMNLEA